METIDENAGEDVLPVHIIDVTVLFGAQTISGY
jgi:hypothetical protein